MSTQTTLHCKKKKKKEKKKKKKKLSETPHKIFLVIFLLPLTLSCYFIMNSLDEKTLSTPPTIPTPTTKLKILFPLASLFLYVCNLL
jgi:flagellar basal body-associated protein FliL